MVVLKLVPCHKWTHEKSSENENSSNKKLCHCQYCFELLQKWPPMIESLKCKSEQHIVLTSNEAIVSVLKQHNQFMVKQLQYIFARYFLYNNKQIHHPKTVSNLSKIIYTVPLMEKKLFSTINTSILVRMVV